MGEHTCLPNIAFTYDRRRMQHVLRPGVYVQSRSIGKVVNKTGSEGTVSYGAGYCKSRYA